MIELPYAQDYKVATQPAIESLPACSAALAIPNLAALIFSAYCSGIRVDFQPPPE